MGIRKRRDRHEGDKNMGLGVVLKTEGQSSRKCDVSMMELLEENEKEMKRKRKRRWFKDRRAEFKKV